MKQDTIANCRNALYQILFYGVMIIYFILLFFLLFRKKAAGSFQSVNLIPFHSIGAYLFSDDMVSRAFALSNLLGNIAIFIPIGVYLPLLIRRKSIFVNTVCVALISAVVEVLQYIFAVGSADIDDVILNTVGGRCKFIQSHGIIIERSDKKSSYNTCTCGRNFFISHTFLGKQVTVVPFAQMC